MYIFKNAWKNITRNKGRNLLIGLIIIVIAASCAVTLAIRQSATDIVNSYEEKNPIKASISMNRNALMEDLKDGEKTQEEMIAAFNDIENLTEEEIISYGTSDYVKEFFYTYSLGVNAKDIKEATDSLVKETTEVKTETNSSSWGQPRDGDSQGFPRGPGGINQTKKTTTTKTEKIFNEKALNGAFTLMGYNSYEDMTEFINGDYVITSGEVSSDFTSSSCVISEELASLNELEVGDTITIVSPEDEDVTLKLEITGIYKENTDDANNTSSMFSASANKIITNVSMVKKLCEKDDELEANITPTFILKSKDVVEDFQKEVEEKGLNKYYTVTNNLEELENATSSIQNVKIFATTFLIITLIIGAVVLSVINMINIRERKYEIGVLRTIGMKKSKVSIQFMLELLIVSVVGLMLGALAGSFMSVPVANNLLKQEINNSTSAYQDVSKNFGHDLNENSTPDGEKENSNTSENHGKNNFFDYNFGIANIKQVDEINAVVDFNVLLKLLGIGILLTLLSSLVSMIVISRFSPLTILKERS